MATALSPKQGRGKKDLPPVETGEQLEQKTFHDRDQGMPGVRAAPSGGMV